jgi:hypothetical protein
MTQWQKFLISVVAVGLSAWGGQYALHPAAPIGAYIAAEATAIGAYLMGWLQIGPAKNGGAPAPQPKA